MKKNVYWFTFIELIISIVIIVILSWIWFVSYSTHVLDARDSQRKSDLLQVSSWLKTYKQKRWYYWLPWDSFNITYSWVTVAIQWKLNQNVHIDSLENLPLDPKTEWYYFYWVTNNKQEYQLAWTLENQDNNIALSMGTYKSVSKNVLPTILVATWATTWTSFEIKTWVWNWSINRMLFVYDNQSHNIPYTFESPYESYSDWMSFVDLLNEVINNNTFWQNSDYRNCTEIYEAWKAIIPFTSTSFEYQVISDTWALVNTWCTL